MGKRHDAKRVPGSQKLRGYPDQHRTNDGAEISGNLQPRQRGDHPLSPGNVIGVRQSNRGMDCPQTTEYQGKGIDHRDVRESCTEQKRKTHKNPRRPPTRGYESGLFDLVGRPTPRPGPRA